MTSPSELCEEDNTAFIVSYCPSSDERKKRSTEDTDDVSLDSELTYDPNYNESAFIQVVGWMNGWNETVAKEFCLKQFAFDPALEACNRLVNISTDLFINECVADIKLSGDTSFIQDTLNTVKGVCLTEATRNEAFYLNQSSETNGLSIFEFISSFLCHRNCSGNGACVNATCSCFDGYIGSDCSGELSSPPENFFLPSNGLCDKRVRECRKTNIMGFFHAENVTAKFAYFKVKDSGIQNYAYTITQTSTYHDYNLISVQIPDVPKTKRRKRSTDSDQTVHGWNISLSNDGITFSNHVTLLIFDGLTHKCDVQILLCHSFNAISSSSTTKTGTTLLAITVGAVIGIVVVIVIIVSIAVVKISKQKRSSVDAFVTMPNSRLGPGRHGNFRNLSRYQPNGCTPRNNHGVNSFSEETPDMGDPPKIDIFLIRDSLAKSSIPPIKTNM
ncbi:von Willebrand factor D and EGF domain-containing protein-like [Saccostrea echinata]|uniref:von Willebrand factor D and EGF domain-containing protein-like n=1 Tax=Saccostrea echinata TaxID=191078 RepID=UPI002A7FF3DE|nr:von Willebrand factor D and EGF domain-containing protein-like [Saccostrea echinata]